MFTVLTRRGWNPAVVLSIALHCALLLAILHERPVSIFVVPSSVQQGNGSVSYHLVYLAPEGSATAEPVERNRLQISASLQKPRPRRGPDTSRRLSDNHDGEASDHSARAGMPYGSLLNGPITGHDVRPGYPVVFPDPPIAKSEIASDVAGDVVVEVTIDDHGDVIETRLLQGVGHGIDEKIVAVLRNWRYHPATIDGRPVASKHDVHFHFPA